MQKQMLKQEAIKRMETLGFLPDVLQKFEKEDKLFLSERQNSLLQATLFYLDDENILNQIKDFENKYEGLVYHVQLSHTTYGDMYSCLFVTKHKDEWAMDWENIDSEALAYVINGDIKEIGTIGIRPYTGGITRTW